MRLIPQLALSLLFVPDAWARGGRGGGGILGLLGLAFIVWLVIHEFKKKR